MGKLIRRKKSYRKKIKQTPRLTLSGTHTLARNDARCCNPLLRQHGELLEVAAGSVRGNARTPEKKKKEEEEEFVRITRAALFAVDDNPDLVAPTRPDKGRCRARAINTARVVQGMRAHRGDVGKGGKSQCTDQRTLFIENGTTAQQRICTRRG